MNEIGAQRKRANPLLGALRALLSYPGSHLRIVLAVQGATALIAFPLVSWLFRRALGIAGLSSLTDANFTVLFSDYRVVLMGTGIILFTSFWWLFEQTVMLTWFMTLREGETPRFRETLRHLGKVLLRRLRPDVFLLIPYAFLLVPLGSLGLIAFLSRGIELPQFIIYELSRVPALAALIIILGAAALYLNLRLSLVAYYLVTAPDMNVAKTFSASWKATKPKQIWLILSYGIALLLSAATLRFSADILLSWVGALERSWPAGAPFGAALAVTAVQGATLLVGGYSVALILEIFLEVAGTQEATFPPKELDSRNPNSRVAEIGALALIITIFAYMTVINTLAFLEKPDEGGTSIAAHRGYTVGAVENSLESLKAAKDAGADLVELDVMQTADGELVVFHDATLRRLAGDPREVAGMTLEELREIELRSGQFTSTIPTFAEFVERASLLDMPLLVELKGSASRGDFVGDVAKTLLDSPIGERSAIQTFSRTDIAELKSRFPDLRVGWLSAFQRGSFDTAGADFLAIEQSSYSKAELRKAQAAGYDVFLWTVTDPAKARKYLRDGVDGIITSNVSDAIGAREAIQGDGSIALRLQDELSSVIAWW